MCDGRRPIKEIMPEFPHFDFSAKRVAESIDVSLHRLGTDHLDIVLCHDIEFVPMQQIVDETIPALRKAKQAGKDHHDAGEYRQGEQCPTRIIT